MTNSVGPFDLLPFRRPGTDIGRQQFECVRLPDFFDAGSLYRLYRMDAPTGEIRNYEDFDADSDDEAIGRALQEAGELRIELWHRGRKIAAISGRDEPAELMIAPPSE